MSEFCSVKVKVSSLLKHLPDDELENISEETKVDFQVKKLTGISMFRLMLYSMINYQRSSLRVMEHFYNSLTFKTFADLGNVTTKFNSIQTRMTRINYLFFEKIFYILFDKFSDLLGEKSAITRFDSTMVAISSGLVSWGMKVGNKTNKKQIKFTIGMKGSLPCHVEIFKTREALNENKTIPVAIFNYQQGTEEIVVFDRGPQDRKNYKKLSDNNRLFVTRIKTDVKYKKTIENKIAEKPKDATVTVMNDYIVLLMDWDTNQWMETSFRLLIATMDKTGEQIYFLTNVEHLTAYEITFIYKQRWDIEVFFKFLKQELNLNHLVSRNENGIKVMIYMTLIVAILLLAYKKLNKLKGYKLVKLQFANELEQEIFKEMVTICNENPMIMKQLFNDS